MNEVKQNNLRMIVGQFHHKNKAFGKLFIVTRFFPMKTCPETVGSVAKTLLKHPSVEYVGPKKLSKRLLEWVATSGRGISATVIIAKPPVNATLETLKNNVPKIKEKHYNHKKSVFSLPDLTTTPQRGPASSNRAFLVCTQTQSL